MHVNSMIQRKTKLYLRACWIMITLLLNCPLPLEKKQATKEKKKTTAKENLDSVE